MNVDQILSGEDINYDPIEQSTEEKGEPTMEVGGEEEGGYVDTEEQSFGGEAEEGGEYEEEGELEEEQPIEEVTHTVKINGSDVALSTSDLIKLAEKGGGADEKFREASMLRQQSQSLIKSLKEDPFSILSQLGVDVNKLTNDKIASMIDYEMMPEDAKRAHDYKLELDRLNGINTKNEESAQKQKHAEAVQQQKAKFLGQIEQAIDGTGGILPKNDYTIGQMARYVSRAREAGIEDVDMTKVANKVMGDYKEHMNNFFSNMDEEKRLEFLGPNAGKIASSYGKKLNKNNFQSSNNRVIRAKQPIEKENTMSDFRSFIDSIK